MTREEMDFIGSMNMVDEISNEAYQKIMTHCEEQEPCEDCISRQAAIEIIKSMTNDNPSYWNSCDVINRENTLDEIEDLPSVTPQPTRWIPCSERLPEGKQEILISLAWDNDIPEVRQGNIDDINYWKLYDHITSIAWMPLPEPYREPTCSECIIHDTDACTRGNTEADEVACEDFVGGESDAK